MPLWVAQAAALVALAFVAGCSCGSSHVRGDAGAVASDAPLSATAEVRAFCDARERSTRSCTESCYAAVDEATAECEDLSREIAAHPEMPALLDCAMGCEPGLECPGRPFLVSCDCADACLRARDPALHELWRDQVRCLDTIIGERCYR